MNIKLFNSVPYSNKEEFIAGLTELGRLLNLDFKVDTFNNKENGYIMYYPENIYTGISFIFTTSNFSAYLYNNNYYSDSVLSSLKYSSYYIYYAISDDKKTVALGFNNSATTPILSIFMTSAVNLTDPNDEIIVFGAQPFSSPKGLIVSKDFYEVGSYNSSILKKDNLVILSPIATLLQNKCYKLHNIYITNTFKSTASTQEFLLNNKYYVSSAYPNDSYSPVWVMQI